MWTLWLSLLLWSFSTIIVFYLLRNKSFLFYQWYLLLSFLYTLVHELGHGFSAIITWGKITSINISFTRSWVSKNWYLGQCSFTRLEGRLVDSFIAYNWELFSIIVTLIGSLCYYYNHLSYFFSLFLVFLFLYLIYWRTLFDKIVWLLLFWFFLLIQFDYLEILNNWGLSYLSTFNYIELQKYIGLVILGVFMWNTLTNLLSIKDTLFSSSSWSDSRVIQEKLFIPSFIITFSWSTLYLGVLIASIILIYSKETGTDYISIYQDLVQYFRTILK